MSRLMQPRTHQITSFTSFTRYKQWLRPLASRLNYSIADRTQKVKKKMLFASLADKRSRMAV